VNEGRHGFSFAEYVIISGRELGTRRMDVVEFLEMTELLGFDPAAFIRKLKSGQL
jgi:hypothetical protein